MILVTGHKGFIGRNLVKYLESLNGYKVIGLDRLDGDVFEQLEALPWDQIKTIYHQGAISNTTILDVADIYYHNVKFSLALFEKAIQYRCDVRYASSGAVYGNSKDYTPQPLNYYALSKLTIDYWIMENIHRFKSVMGFRYFNVYGADEKKDDFATSPIYRFSEQAKNTGVIKIFSGSHKTYRDFVSVEDVVNVIANSVRVSGIYDLGSMNPISFLDVAELVANKYNATVQFIPMPEILKGRYQFYTKARPHFTEFIFYSVKDWLEKH